MRVPEITSIKNALIIYYHKLEIGNRDIVTLFGKLSSATIARIKKAVKSKMIEDETPSYGIHTVNTKTAFEVWGIDVADLEARWTKINDLRLAE